MDSLRWWLLGAAALVFVVVWLVSKRAQEAKQKVFFDDDQPLPDLFNEADSAAKPPGTTAEQTLTASHPATATDSLAQPVDSGYQLGAAAEDVAQSAPESTSEPAENFPILYVVKKTSAIIGGPEIVRTARFRSFSLTANGMFELKNEHNVTFSICNMFQPGLFNADAMLTLQTKGLALFASDDTPLAKQQLLEHACHFAEQLGCDLIDEHQTTLDETTAQDWLRG